VAATKLTKISDLNRLMLGNSTKHRNQSIAYLSLLAICAVAIPNPAIAQIPTLNPSKPSRGNTLPAPPIQVSPTGVNTVPVLPVPVNVPVPGTVPVPAPAVPPGQINPLPNSSGAAAPSLSVSDEAYTLGPGDRVKMDVFDVPEYSGEFSVLVDGTLNLPVIGRIPVRGRSLESATDIISARYARYVKRPLITLGLVSARPVTLAVAGEVNRPGTYSLAGGGGGTGATAIAGQFPTVTQAITLAGGITQSADVRNVTIRRRIGASNQTQNYSVNLWDLIQRGNLAQDIALRDGDTILINAVDRINPTETRQLADASFASKEIKPINIAIVGEVSRPGPYAITGGGEGTGGATGAITGTATGVSAGNGTGTTALPTVTKAVQVAGGITALANVRGITIRRTTRLGETKIINVNLWELLRAGDASQDVILQEGDTITVPTATAFDPAESTQLAGASFAPNTIVVNVVGEVAKPGAIPVPPNTPLNQAVLAAGGFNVRARKRSVDLIRLNPNGSVEKREVDVDLAQGINEKGNPTLRNNDVVVVRRSTLAAVGDTLGTVLNPVGSFLNIFSIFRTLGGN
jgi:polysaccharide biosynthesis/export protein